MKTTRHAASVGDVGAVGVPLDNPVGAQTKTKPSIVGLKGDSGPLPRRSPPPADLPARGRRTERPGMNPAPATLSPRDFLATLDTGSRPLGLFRYIGDISYFIKDRTGHYMAANDAFVHLMGYQRADEILGRTDHELISPILADACRMDDEEVMTTGESIVNKAELVPHNVLSVGWYATTKLPLRDRSGVIVGIEGTTREFKAARGASGPYPELSAIIDYVEQHYAQRFTIDDLAREAGLTARTLERLFSRRFSMTPFAYIKRVRLNAACRMLSQSALPIAQIAVSCGFCDQSYMTKEFGRLLRTTPQVYRDTHAL